MSRAFSAGFETYVFLGRCPRLMMKPRRWRFGAARLDLSAASESLNHHLSTLNFCYHQKIWPITLLMW
jgi:hypothetical protein